MGKISEYLDSLEAELHQNILVDLRAIRDVSDWSDIESHNNEEPWLDIRLRLDRSGSYDILTGDPCYDTDHRGFWGSGSISRGSDEVELIALSRSLVDEALGQAHEDDA